MLGKHPQIQINRRKPALAVIQQRIYLLIGKRGSAPLGIDRQLGMVKPKLRRIAKKANGCVSLAAVQKDCRIKKSDFIKLLGKFEEMGIGYISFKS